MANWERLKNNRCPKCDYKLMCGSRAYYNCCNCPFKIKEARFNEIVNEMILNKTQDQEKNLSELNNL